MPRIGKREYKAAFDQGLTVYNNEASAPAAAATLVSAYGMSLSSAYSYVRTVDFMLRGEFYKRTLNIKATRHFLASIKDQFGAEGLDNALVSLEGHIDYYQRSSNVGTPGLSALLAEFRGNRSNRVELTDYGVDDVELAEAMALSDVELAKKLPKRGFKPSKIKSTTTVFSRNQYVIAKVLRRANGICEICKHPAPFNRKVTGKPFLEVHHKVRLADGGDDTAENAIAVCPNCHRQQHYG